MTTNWKALCAEPLAQEAYVAFVQICKGGSDDAGTYDADEAIVRRALKRLHELESAALAEADEPAVPEGREPAAVTGQPSDEEWDALVERVWDKYETVGHQGERFMYDGDFGSALDLVRKELFRWGHQPAPPADGEAAELVETLKGIAYWRRHGKPGEPAPTSFDIRQADRLDRAAELLQRQALVPVPVPVGERPWEREEWCDTDGLCWLGSLALDGFTPTWLFGPPAWAERFPNVHRVLLPAHALPLPEVDNG